MIVKYLNESLIELRNNINMKKIPENENPKKVVNTENENPKKQPIMLKKILNFNKQQKGKEIKILTPKKLI